jgi:hypothetical protein
MIDLPPQPTSGTRDVVLMFAALFQRPRASVSRFSDLEDQRPEALQKLSLGAGARALFQGLARCFEGRNDFTLGRSLPRPTSANKQAQSQFRTIGPWPQPNSPRSWTFGGNDLTPNAVVGAAPQIAMASKGIGPRPTHVEDSKIGDRDADQAVDNRAPSIGESSRKHRKSLDLQPVRACSVKR